MSHRYELNAKSYFRWCREVGHENARIIAIAMHYTISEIAEWENELNGKL
jgi:hypothetical protein